MGGYIGSKAVSLSTTSADVTGDADIGGDLTVDTNTLHVDSTNNRVGVRTSSPASLIHANNTSGDATVRITSSDTGYAQVFLGDQTSGSQGRLEYYNNNNSMGFYTAGTEAMRIISNGSVGIGTSSPTSLGTGIPTLELKGNSASQADRAGGIRFERYDGTYAGAVYNADGAFYHDAGAYPMLFYTNSAEKMRIHTSAAAIVSIGKTGSGTAGQGMVLVGNPSSPQQYFNKSYSGTVNGVLFYHSDSYVGGINYNNTSTVFATSSDYRLKTDLQPMTNASARVQALNPVNFEWISEGTRVDGFLAHEVQAIVPEAVSGAKDAMRDEEYEVTPAVLDDDGNVVTEAVMATRSVPDYQGIDQSKLVPLLTAALQEALTKIDELETRLDALEAN